MAVALCDVGRRGRIAITFVERRGQTEIGDCYCEVPYKVTRIHRSHPSGFAHLILMQCTAGLFGGDTVECDIHVKSGARVLITQQAALKIHPAGPSAFAKPAVQTNRIRIESGGELHIHYDPVIPFAGAVLHQTTRIDVESGSRLRFWESVMTGRLGSGESWKFREVRSETSIRVDRRLVHLDRFCIQPGRPERVDLDSAWIMKGCGYLGTGLIFDETGTSPHVENGVPDFGIDSPVPGLTVVRVATAHGPEFHNNAGVRLVFPPRTD